MQIQKASQLLWSCVPYPVAVDSLVCVELVFSPDTFDTLKKRFKFHIPCLLLILVTFSTYPMSSFLKGDFILPWESLFPPLIAEASSGNLKTSLTIPSSLYNGLSYRLQSHYVLDCCGGPCLSVRNCGRMWCLLCPPDSYELMRCKEHSAYFLSLPSIGILFRGNGCLSGTSASTVTCLMVIGRQLTIWMTRNAQRAFSFPLLLGLRGRVAESSK